MKVYSGIKGIKPPKLDVNDVPKYERECKEYIKKISEWCKNNCSGKHLGEMIKFPVGDGYAQYVVMSDRELIHIDIWDGWDYPYIEHLPLAAITEYIEGQKALSKIFTA